MKGVFMVSRAFHEVWRGNYGFALVPGGVCKSTMCVCSVLKCMFTHVSVHMFIDHAVCPGGACNEVRCEVFRDCTFCHCSEIIYSVSVQRLYILSIQRWCIMNLYTCLYTFV